MNKEKVLSLILEVDKSIWKYWNDIQNLFKSDMKFFIKELELCDDIIEKIIGYQHSEENISSDPILNITDDYHRDIIGLNGAVKDLLKIEQFLKDNKLYREYNNKELINDVVNLFLLLEEKGDMLHKFFDTDDTCPLLDEIFNVERIINNIFGFKSEYFEDHVLIKFIEYQLQFKSFEEIKYELINIGRIVD